MKYRTGILLGVMAILLAGCGNENENSATQQPSTQQIEGKTEKEAIPETAGETLSADEISYISEEERNRNPPVTPEQSVDIGTPVTVKEQDEILLAYTVKKVETGKKIGNHPELNFVLDEEMEDEQNTNEEHSFVWVTVSVKNEDTERELDFTAGNLCVRLTDITKTNGILADNRSIESEADGDMKGHYILAPGQDITVTLGYVMKDEYLAEMYYQVGGPYPYMVGEDMEKDLRFGEQEIYFLKLFE